MLEFGPEANERVKYDEAWLYCVTCTHDNKYDWRLPTHKEYTDSPIMMSWFDCDDGYVQAPLYKCGFHVTPVRTKDA